MSSLIRIGARLYHQAVMQNFQSIISGEKKMNKPALVVVEQETNVATGNLTVAEKLRSVLNNIIEKKGHVAINVTRLREFACMPHKITTASMFDEKTAFQGPHGLLLMKFQGALYSPQAGEVPFQQWINRSYTSTDNGEMTQPIGDFTRWS